MVPGGVLVVEAAVGETSVEDADEMVPESSECASEDDARDLATIMHDTMAELRNLASNG